jgi:hypothetical protein
MGAEEKIMEWPVAKYIQRDIFCGETTTGNRNCDGKNPMAASKKKKTHDFFIGERILNGSSCSQRPFL